MAVNWITAGTSCTESCGNPTTVVLGDFNGDGNLDLAVNDGFVGAVFVLLGNGDGTFQAPPIHSGAAASVGGGYNVLVAGDSNVDGKLDLAMSVGGVYPQFPDLLVFSGNGDGSFAGPVETSVGTAGTFPGATTIAATDLNGDKFLDLALATNTGFATGLGYNAVTVALNCGLRCSNVTLSSSPTTSAFNQSVTFTAMVTPANGQATQVPAGSVVFQDVTGTPAITMGTAALSSGTAVFTYSALAIGRRAMPILSRVPQQQSCRQSLRRIPACQAPAWACLIWSFVLVIVTAVTGCGGGRSSTGPSGTPARTSQVTATGTSGSSTQSVTFALIVQ
jgi:hypothetical protein